MNNYDSKNINIIKQNIYATQFILILESFLEKSIKIDKDYYLNNLDKVREYYLKNKSKVYERSLCPCGRNINLNHKASAA